MTRESSAKPGLGVPGDPLTFQTNFFGMLDHVGTHVDAFRHMSWEWLVNLEQLLGKGEFQFFGVPPKVKGGSGSPVRAFAIVND